MNGAEADTWVALKAKIAAAFQVDDQALDVDELKAGGTD